MGEDRMLRRVFRREGMKINERETLPDVAEESGTICKGTDKGRANVARIKVMHRQGIVGEVV